MLEYRGIKVSCGDLGVNRVESSERHPGRDSRLLRNVHCEAVVAVCDD